MDMSFFVKYYKNGVIATNHQGFKQFDDGAFYKKTHLFTLPYNYKNCIFHYKPTHSVTIVGWGHDENIDYWIVKNSWGDKWGDDGYFKVQMKNNGVGNFCI